MSSSPDPTIASRYLANQLSEGERAEYEALLTRSASALAELEAVARLKVGLVKLSEDGELPALQARAARATWPRLLALAAAIAVVFLGVEWGHRPGMVSAPLLTVSASFLRDQEGHALPLVATTLIFHRRADTADASIDLPDSRGVLEWRWTSSTGAAHDRYDVVLTKADQGNQAEIVGEVAGLQADASGQVKWYVDSAGLVPGLYKLKLSGHGAPGQPIRTESFLIRVRVNSNK